MKTSAKRALSVLAVLAVLVLIVVVSVRHQAPAVSTTHPVQVQVNQQQTTTDGGGAALVVFFIVGLLAYFIPSFVAWKKQRQDAIIVLNLLLGWTLLGWIGALIWAMCEKPVQTAKAS